MTNITILPKQNHQNPRDYGTAEMARNRREKDAMIKLAKPDRSGPDPSQQTLLDLAEQRGLLKDPQETMDEVMVGGNGEPLIGRLGESIFWSSSLTMLHFTLDVLVSHQYAVAVEWPVIFRRAGQAFPSMLHPTCRCKQS